MSAEVATQPRNLPLLATPERCSGGTYIVTGANTGLGFEAAKHLVSLGAACVIMAVRNPSAGEAAKARIEAEVETTGRTGVAQVWPLDMASYASVRAFASRAARELDRVDGLIENAGVALGTLDERAEGHLLSVTVNVLSTFLLGVLLFPKLRETASRLGRLSHLVIVSSGVGFDAREAWEGIQDDPLVKMDSGEFEGMKQ